MPVEITPFCHEHTQRTLLSLPSIAGATGRSTPPCLLPLALYNRPYGRCPDVAGWVVSLQASCAWRMASRT